MSKPENAMDAPALKKLVCALILGADHPISAAEIQRIVSAVAEEERAEAEAAAKEVADEELEAIAKAAENAAAEAEASGAGAEKIGADAAAPEAPPEGAGFALSATPEPPPAAVSLSAIKSAIREAQALFHELDIGVALAETADGFRFHTASDCGKWIRKMLNKGKPQRLPRAAVETLAIIAYRQPVSRSEIESIRGVSAGHIIKALMEMQLARIIGRSDLPGRPFLFGTTQAFLDHFGLKTLNELEPALKREK